MTPDAQDWVDLERARVVPQSRTIRAHAPAFPSYARVFFPVTTNGARPRSWSETFDRPVAADLRWDDRSARRLEMETATGDLPGSVAAPLLRALQGEADTIVFGYWAGYGDIAAPADAFTAVFPPDERDLWLLRARGHDVADLAARIGRGPMRWYPEHRRWSVTADIYDRSVIVGGDGPVIDAVLASHDLEAVKAPASLLRSALA